MLITKFVEVPNTNIREEVLPHQYEYDLLYSMAQEFGHAELVWYALNGKRVVEGEYTDRDYPPPCLTPETYSCVRTSWGG